MNHFIINKIILFLLILIIKQYSSKNKIYKIPFGLYNTKNLNNSLDMVDNIFSNLFYVNLSIGTPPQIIPFFLSLNAQTFSIPYNIFNNNKSSSYESISKKEISYEYEIVANGFNSRDILNIDNNTNKKIDFILGTKYKTRNDILGIIGLRIPKRVQYGVYPFFQSLRKGGFINEYSWTLKFFDNVSLLDTIVYNKNKNNIIGEFIFGDEPHNYETEKNKYNITEYLRVSPLSSSVGSIYWDIEFKSIYLINKENQIDDNNKFIIQGGKRALLKPEIGFIIGSNEFFYSIKNNFFNKYLENNICSINKIDNYSYIECKYNDNSFILSSFPKICFEHIGFETIFNLTYQDLFVLDKINNKYIFLILNRENNSDWELGSIFFRKFQLVFNEDYKTIGFYKSSIYKEEKNETEEQNKGIIKYIILIILLISFSFLLILIGMLIQKKCCSKDRKKRLNEFDENYSYENIN